MIICGSARPERRSLEVDDYRRIEVLVDKFGFQAQHDPSEPLYAHRPACRWRIRGRDETRVLAAARRAMIVACQPLLDLFLFRLELATHQRFDGGTR